MHPLPVLASTVLGSCLLAVQAAHAAEPPQPRFRAVTLDAAVGIGYGLAVADVDGDGRRDIILCDKNQIAWYANPDWKKHVIAENLTRQDHVCVAAADIDGDGKAEIAVGAGWNPGDTRTSGALFHLKAPADRTARWEPVPLPHDPTIHRIRWVRDWQERQTLVSVPLHGIGNDPGKGEGDGVKITRYTPPAGGDGDWTPRVLIQEWHKTHNFDPVQWDDDVAEELLVGAKEGAFLLDWSRERSGYVATRLTGPENGGIGEIRHGRLGPDRRFVTAISPMHGNQLVLLTPDAAGTGEWNRRVLDDTLIDGHALACGDFLGIGRDQIAVGWRAMNRPGVRVGIKLLTPLDAEGREWRTSVVDDNTMACEDLALADFDGDGRLDIVAAGRATKNLVVYFNETPRP